MRENRKIIFTKPGVAEVVSCEMPEIGPDEVLIETDYTAISAGTSHTALFTHTFLDGTLSVFFFV